MSENVKDGIKQILRGAVIVATALFSGITLLALIVNGANLNAQVLTPSVQVIKPLAVLIGVLFSVKAEKGFIKGALSGGAGYALALLLLLFLPKIGVFPTAAITDLLLFLLYGALSGVLAARIKS